MAIRKPVDDDSGNVFNEELGQLVESNPNVVPVRITYEGIGRVEPQPDITPLESVQLSILLCCSLSLPVPYKLDVDGFIDQHKLNRHFVKE